MASFYCVVQYVPDPIANERMNVGLIAYDAESVACRFVRDWKRVRAFGDSDITFLRDFARDIQAASSKAGTPFDVVGVRHLTADKIQEMARRWTNSIQLTAPCVSSLPVPELVDDMAPMFLRQPAAVATKSRRRSRAQAAELVTKQVESALSERLGEAQAKQLLKLGEFADGDVGRYRFDFQVANGHLLLAGHTLSFEGEENQWLRKDIYSTAWAFEDLADRDPDVDRAVVMLEPDSPMKAYDEAKKTFTKLKVKIVTGDNLVTWSEQAAERTAELVAGHRFG